MDDKCYTGALHVMHVLLWVDSFNTAFTDHFCSRYSIQPLQRIGYGNAYGMNGLTWGISSVNEPLCLPLTGDTHTQPFYGSMDFVWNNPGELVPEETFTHSHLLWSSIVPYLLFHLIWSMVSSLFNPRAWVFSTISLQVFFGLPLGLAPSTSYSIHFFTQSLSSFRNTCPHHHSLFCKTVLHLSIFNLRSHYQTNF